MHKTLNFPYLKNQKKIMERVPCHARTPHSLQRQETFEVVSIILSIYYSLTVYRKTSSGSSIGATPFLFTSFFYLPILTMVINYIRLKSRVLL